MAESELGTAVLSLRVETGPALAALKAFRAQVESSLGTADTSGLFKGVESDARAAGKKAGKALADGVKKQTKELKFGSFQQALDFTPKNSIKGLEEYARALRNLRDRTDLTAAGTQQLTDRLGAVDAALRRARQTTAETTAEQRRFNEALDKVALQRFSEQARSFAAGLREQARAAAANAEQFRKMREQAESAAKAVASLAAKGVGEALKVPIFGLPKNVTGTFDKARAQIERLQRQAETASGKVARLSEGVAVLGAGGVAAKGVIDVLGGIGGAAAETTGILSQVQEALASLPGPLKGLGGLDEVFSSGAQAVSSWAASILQAQGELSTLAAPLQAVTNSLGALGPEAVAVGGALAFTFAGFQDLIAKSFKPGVDGARAALKGMTADTQALLEALARASEAASGIASLQDLRIAEKDATDRVKANPVGSDENLQASRELLEIQRRIKEELQAQFYQDQSLLVSERERARIAQQLLDAAKPSGPLALPSSQMLNAEGRGIRRLAPEVGPAIDVGIQSARNFTTELLNAARAGGVLPPIFGQIGLSLESLNELVAEQTQGYKFQNELLQDQLALEQQLRAAEEQRSRDARARLAQDVQERKQRAQLASEALLQSQPSPRQFGLSKDAKKRLGSAVDSGLIGGAFPLLFGQGLGASVGGGVLGAAGGAMGGQFGFGLSLIGTALGQQADNLGKLSQALQDPIGRFQELQQAAVISSRSLEKNIEALINAGRYAEAEAKIREDLAKQGLDAATANQLATETDKLQRSLAQLGLSIGLVVQGPLTDLVNGFNRLLEPGKVAAQSRAIQSGLSPEDLTAYQNRRRELNRGGLGIVDANKQANDEFASRTRDAQRARERLAAAQVKDNELISAQYRLIDANVQGYQRLALERQKELVIAEKIQALGADPTNAIKIEQDAAKRLYEIEQQLKAIANTNSFAGLNAALAELENKQIRLSVDSTAFEAANQQILATQNALEQLDGKKAIITVEQINAGVQNGSLTNNFNNLERRAQSAQQALNSAQFGSPEFQKALRATQEANFELAQRRRFADPNALSNGLEEAKKQEQQASEAVSSAFQRAQQAADALAQAQKNLRSALEGSFDLLTREYQQSVLAQAKASLSTAVGAGFFDRGKVQDIVNKGSAKDIISAANQARSVLDADNQLKQAKVARAESEKELTSAINALNKKDWNVNVDTSGSQGASVSSDLPRGVEVYK